MITAEDYEAIRSDIESKTGVEVELWLSNVKKQGIYIELKHIKRNQTETNANTLICDWQFSIICNDTGIDSLVTMLNIESCLIDDLNIMKDGVYSLSKGVIVDNDGKRLAYALKDNDEDPEENETENGNITYQRNYEMQILFRK